MDKKEKQELSESDIRAKFVTPALVDAGWDEMTQIRREVTLTPGPVIVRGNMSSRNKKKKKFADYVLQIKKGLPVAVLEAKDNKKPVERSRYAADDRRSQAAHCFLEHPDSGVHNEERSCLPKTNADSIDNTRSI